MNDTSSSPPNAANDSRYDDLENAFLASKHRDETQRGGRLETQEFKVIRYADPEKVDGIWQRREDLVGRYDRIEDAVKAYISLEEGVMLDAAGRTLAHRGIVEERGAFVGAEQFSTKEIQALVEAATNAKAQKRSETQHSIGPESKGQPEAGEPAASSVSVSTPNQPDGIHAQRPEPIELTGAAEYAAYPLAAIFGAAVAAARAPFVSIARVTQERVERWRRTSAMRAYQGACEASHEIAQRLDSINAHPKTQEYQREMESAISNGDRKRENDAFRHYRNYLAADVPFDKDGSNLTLKENLSKVFQLARRLEWQMTTAIKRTRSLGRDPQALRDEFTRILGRLSEQTRLLRGPDGRLLKEQFAQFSKVITRFVERLFSSLRPDARANASPRM